MRRTFVAATAAMLAVGLSAPAAIAAKGIPGNPMGTGNPDQTCQTVEGGNFIQTPGNGHATLSPGSVFNETPPGGIGGQAYTTAGSNSQYDVACYQTTNHSAP